MRVFVYMHKPLTKKLGHPVYSVKALEGSDKGKVIGRYADVWLVQARAKVSEAGRRRVIREGSKNVHAGIEGIIVSLTPGEIEVNHRRGSKIRYNPRETETFVYTDTGEEYRSSRWAHLCGEGVFVE